MYKIIENHRKMEMRRKIEMSNMLIDKERKREYMEKPFATTRDNVAYDVRVIVNRLLQRDIM
jgi:hypothetical protein